VTPEFWQRLLAAELSPSKCRVLLESLGTSAYDPESIVLRSSLLTEGEKGRFRDAEVSMLPDFMASGVELATSED